jgi:hypothetical protein
MAATHTIPPTNSAQQWVADHEEELLSTLLLHIAAKGDLESWLLCEVDTARRQRVILDHTQLRQAILAARERVGECLVVLETMPMPHRKEWRARGHWGRYPHNGAVRSVVPHDEAVAIIAADPDHYARIVEV